MDKIQIKNNIEDKIRQILAALISSQWKDQNEKLIKENSSWQETSNFSGSFEHIKEVSIEVVSTSPEHSLY